jgi:hypothetical protein
LRDHGRVEITDPVGGRWMVVRQVGAWRRKSRVAWVFEVWPSPVFNDLASLVVGIPALVLALIVLALALVELALLLVVWPVALLPRAIRVMGWRVIVMNTAKPVGVEEKTGAVLLRQARFSTTVLRVETMAGSVRLRNAIAEHLHQGGDVMDPVIGQWLADERGKVVLRETKPNPEPVKPKTEPA